MRRVILGLMLLLAVVGCHRDEPMANGKPLSHWKKEATKVSLFTFWNSDKDERRREAFRRLMEIGEPAVPALVELLQHKNISVSGDAFNALANLGPRAASAVPAMIELLTGESPTQRRHAAWILGSIGPAAEAAVPHLTRMLEDSDARVRQTAAQALGQIGGTGHSALEGAQESDKAALREASMRGMAARELTSDERRALVETGLRDPSAEVRLRAIDLLMRVHGTEAEALAAYLVQALNDNDARVKEAAHTVLTVYTQHGATPGLLAQVLTGGDVEARADAAWHLGHASGARGPLSAPFAPNDSAVIASLRNGLSDVEPKVRLYAARAMAQSEGAATREAGLAALRREMPTAAPILAVRAARILWIASRDLAEVTPIYDAGLKDPEKWNRVETMSAIMEMGRNAERFRPQFEQLTSDPDPEVRDRAEKALRWLGRTVERLR